MSTDDGAVKGAADNWRTNKSNFRESQDELVSILKERLRNNNTNLKKLAEVTGIKRTTLYYMLWGKEGKSGQDTAA